MLPEVKKDAERRLKSIQGQIDGLLRMIEEDQYCIDVLMQLKAVQSALLSARNLVLEGYLQSCMLERVREGDEERAVKEIMSILKYGD